MPKTKLDKYRLKAPPIDDAWGAVLVRKEQMGYSLKSLAEKAGVGYDRLRHLWMRPPYSWPQGARDKILNALELKEVVRYVDKNEGEDQ